MSNPAAYANGIKFTDADVVEVGECIYDGEYNPHNVRPWLLHDHGFALAVVFASDVQDALDIAADGGNLDRFMVTDVDSADYEEDDARITYLGNGGKPFDIESLGIIELRSPPRSFVAEYNAAFQED